MTRADGTNRRRSGPDSEQIIVERQSRPRSEEEKARHRSVGKFWKGKKDDGQNQDDDEEEKPKKQPWYKGKKLEHKPFTVRNQLGATIFNSWMNLLLLAAPVGIAINYAGVNGKVVFVVNFIAIIPLAGMLSFATEEIALHVGESLGGLLNASSGNAVEMIVAIIALVKRGRSRPDIVDRQYFIESVARSGHVLLLRWASEKGTVLQRDCSTDCCQFIGTCRGQRGYSYSFRYMDHYDGRPHCRDLPWHCCHPPSCLPPGAIAKGLVKAGGTGAGPGRAKLSNRLLDDELIRPTAYEQRKEEPEEPQLHIFVAWATLAGATTIIGLCAEFMVDGISSIVDGGHISVEFVGLILLPIVGNAAEHATAVTVACKDKMDLAIGVAVGSSMQVSLLLIPLMVVLGWILGNDVMNLSFDGFQVAVLFVAVLLVNDRRRQESLA